MHYQGGCILYAHRAVYEYLRGPIPDGLDLDHLCRVTMCVNPDHLDPVTTATNCQRGIRTHLKPDDIRNIRALSGAISQYTIAEWFGVSQAAISSIVRRKTWKNIV